MAAPLAANQIKVFTVQPTEGKIKIYDVTGTNVVQTIAKEELKGIHDSVYSESDRCFLGVSYLDANEPRLYKIPLDPPHDITSTEIAGTTSEVGLSKAESDGVETIIACVRQHNVIKELATDGAILRTIELTNKHWPRQAVKLNKDFYTHYFNGHEQEEVEFFATCYGYGDPGTEDGEHQVCLVRDFAGADGSWTGEVIKSFGDVRGPSINQLNAPSRMVVDSNGSIFVGDTGNKRILKLDRELEIPEVVYTSDLGGRDNFFRLILDEENNKLFTKINNELAAIDI